MDEKLKQKLIEAVKAGDENQASELLCQVFHFPILLNVDEMEN